MDNNNNNNNNNFENMLKYIVSVVQNLGADYHAEEFYRELHDFGEESHELQRALDGGTLAEIRIVIRNLLKPFNDPLLIAAVNEIDWLKE